MFLVGIEEHKASMRLPKSRSFGRADGLTALWRRSGVIPLFVLLLISVTYSEFQRLSVDRETVVFFTSISLVGSTLHFITHKSENWLRIDTVFIIAFLVTNFQWPFMYAVAELMPRYGFQQRSLDAAGNYAVALAAISLLSWLIGFATAPRSAPTKRLDVVRNWRYVAVLFAISTVGFAYFAGAEFFNRTIYTTLQSNLTQTVSGISAYLFDIAQVMATLALALVCYERFVISPSKSSRRNKVGSNVLIGLLLTYCAIFLIGGDRGQVVQILIGFALAFAATVRPVRFWEFALLTLVGFGIFTLIGIWRSGAEVSAATVLQEYGYWQISANLAQSVVPLTQSVLIVEADGFSFGFLWLSQIVGIIPFAQQLMFSWTDLSLADVSSSVLITIHTLGANAGSGLGTSFVADIYLNFGVSGLILLSVLFGAICARMSAWLEGGGGFYRYLLAIVFASLVVYVARSSFIFQIKPMIWSVGFCWLLLRVRQWRSSQSKC